MASLALLTALLVTATTPEQARAQRAVPVLPPPTMVVANGSRTGVLAVPEGAIMTDGQGRLWVRVRTDRDSRRVEVQKVPTNLPKLIEVVGTGLHAGDLVELVASDDADAPPRGSRTR